MRRFARWQQAAVEHLKLRPGQWVIDIACGTGLNFTLLEERIGPDGRIIGIDLSPEMLARDVLRSPQGVAKVVAHLRRR